MSDDDFQALVDASLKRGREEFDGKYQEEIKGLLGLSKSEIDKITPDTTDLQVYDQLIKVVKAASSTNASQEALRDRIISLGSVAVKIAKQVAPLAAIL